LNDLVIGSGEHRQAGVSWDSTRQGLGKTDEKGMLKGNL